MSSSSPELHELVEALLNEEISGDQHAQLQEILLLHPELQQQYFRHIDLHLGLKSLTATAGEVARLPPVMKTVERRSPEFSRPARAWLLAAMVLLLLTAGIFLAWPHRRESLQLVQPVSPAGIQKALGSPARVILAQAAGAELFDEMLPALEQGLEYGHQYVLLNGLIQLLFPDGATAVIQSPAVFLIDSPERLNLRVGQCSVHAPDGAEGFQVNTPKARVVDLGTRFSVSVDEVGQSDIQVIEGAAEMHTTALPGKPMETLREGDARRCAGELEGPREIPFNRSRYRGSLPDRVVSYEAVKVGEGPAVRDLLSVVVQRGGMNRKYMAEELIGLDVIGFRSASNANNLAWDGTPPENPEVALSRDRALNTGLINFNTDHSEGNEMSGLSVRFHRPIINGPGPDVVFFEIQSVIYPIEGDHFVVHPLQPAEGLQQHQVRRFDITLKSENALQVAPFKVFVFDAPCRTWKDLARLQRQQRSLALPFSALAVGIDLSDLGYAEGAAVEGLRFEDAGDDEDIVDPVFIAGLPSVEAASLSQSSSR